MLLHVFVLAAALQQVQGDAASGPNPPQSPIARVVIAPVAQTVEAGDTLRLRPQALDAAGRAVSGVVFRYTANPNGSVHDIAGITNEAGNVVGLMPHPEHSVEELTGAGTDGLGFFRSLMTFLSAQL